MFRSLRLYNYRVWFIAALISNIGFWTQAVAQNWVVLTELTDHDAVAVGIATALQTAPPLLLVGVTGWVTDRFERHTMLYVTQGALGVLALTTGALLLFDVMTLPAMYAFALAIGIATAFDTPARNAFVSDLVTADYASNAVALNSASFNVARMVGPAVGGLTVVAVGSGWAFLINAISFVATFVGLSIMRRDQLVPRVPGPRRRMADGFRYVVERPDFLMLFVMTFLMSAFALNFPIIASTMTIVFGRDADAFGLLSSAFAMGALVGALLNARRKRARLRIAALMALVFSVGSFLSAAMPTYGSYAGMCALIGFGAVSFFSTANGYVQSTTEPGLRGRVLAIYIAIFIGSTPFGAPILGWVANAWGPRASILVAASAGLVAATVAVGWYFATTRQRQ